MSRIAYVNGQYRPLDEPLIAVQDRGFQFADAIYEVWGVRGGALLDTPGHFARLDRSLRELKMRAPMGHAALHMVLREVLRRNRVRDGLLYLQISRGAPAARDHAFPEAATAPTIVVTAKRLPPATWTAQAAGVAVISVPEMRWARCDIKSTSLLPNVLAKQAAREAGAAEAWFVDKDGAVTEGASTNAWIVDAAGKLRTRALSNAILPGVTRATLMRLAEERQMPIDERPFTLEEAFAAREAFISSATNAATPVVRIDGRTVGDGTPGPIARALRAAYLGDASFGAAAAAD